MPPFTPQKILLSLVIAAAAIAAPSRDASACGSAISFDREERRTLGEAQAALEEGRYDLARSIAFGVERSSDQPAERERARWVIAMSYVRDEKNGEPGLAYAVEELRAIRARRSATDVTSRIDLGEALARSPNGQAEARALLEPLAAADLIGSEHAYAALVGIGSDLGTRLTALDRCRTLTEGERTFCHRGFLPSMSPRTVDEADRAAPYFVNTFAGGVGLSAFATLILVVLRRRRATSRLVRAYAGRSG